MASKEKNLSQYNYSPQCTFENKKIAIVQSKWNEDITNKLYEECYDTLTKFGVKKEKIELSLVPGSFELPIAAKMILSNEKYDSVICLGCVIQGETKHDDYINEAIAHGIMTLSLASSIPVIFGVLTTNTKQQALDRAGGAHGNKGVEAAITALHMIELAESTSGKKQHIGF